MWAPRWWALLLPKPSSLSFAPWVHGHCQVRGEEEQEAMDMQGLLAAQAGRQAAVRSGMELVRRRRARRPWWPGCPPHQVTFKNEQGWLGTQGPRGGLSLCPGPWPRRGRGASCLPPKSFCSPWSQCSSHPHPKEMAWTEAIWGGSHATTEPIGLGPSARALPSAHLPGRDARMW